MLLTGYNPAKHSVRQTKIDDIVNAPLDSPSLKIIKLRAFESNQIAKDRLTKTITDYQQQQQMKKALKGGTRFKTTKEIKINAIQKILARNQDSSQVKRNLNKFFFEVRLFHEEKRRRNEDDALL